MQRAIGSIDAIKVVSFDLDDTFWDCAPAIANAEQALFDWHAENTPRITAAHDPQSLLQFRVMAREQHPELAGCVTAMRMQGLRSLLLQFDYPESMATEAFDKFYRARSEVVIYPGVIELLQRLSERYSLAAITNGNADLAYIGIDRFFNKIYAADLELKAKPHADMFKRCREHFGVAAHQVLHIGDNPVTDVGGALAAGLQAVWFNQHKDEWPNGKAEAHFEVQSITQMNALLSL